MIWRPWLRINRVLRVMLHTRWSAEAWPQVRVEFRKALALRSETQRAGDSQRCSGMRSYQRTRFLPLAHRANLFHYELQGRWH